MWRITRPGWRKLLYPIKSRTILQGIILITMENYSDSDTSSESEYESGQGSAAESEYNKDELYQSLEPEPSKFYNK